MQPEKVYVFDTTLRDGEQAAGTRLARREKLSVARQLSQLRVDIIEAGYPRTTTPGRTLLTVSFIDILMARYSPTPQRGQAS